MNEPKLEPAVQRSLDAFVDSARIELNDDLAAIVLFGSAASAELRATSDVNLVMVLRKFDSSRIDGVREALRTAHALIRLDVMFLLASEVEAAASAFPDKFADILRRRRVLYGEDPFAGLTLSRADEIKRMKQTLLNLVLRLRNRYAMTSLREEQAARALAESAGPMRAAAAMLLDLSGEPYSQPKEALLRAAQAWPDHDWTSTLEAVSRAREGEALAQGAAGAALLSLISLAQRMHARAEAIAEAQP